MATATETKTQVMPVVDEATVHNAGISERYLRLKNAIDEQFEEAKAQATSARASVLSPERPPEVVQPTQMEYGHTRVQSELFTVQTLDRTLERHAESVSVQPEIVLPSVQPQAQEDSYSLNMSVVKKALLIFASTATVLLSIIGINTQIINATEARIAGLTQKNAEIVAEIEELQEKIAYEKSEEVIASFAEANGLVKGN